MDSSCSRNFRRGIFWILFTRPSITSAATAMRQLTGVQAFRLGFCKCSANADEALYSPNNHQATGPINGYIRRLHGRSTPMPGEGRPDDHFHKAKCSTAVPTENPCMPKKFKSPPKLKSYSKARRPALGTNRHGDDMAVAVAKVERNWRHNWRLTFVQLKVFVLQVHVRPEDVADLPSSHTWQLLEQSLKQSSIAGVSPHDWCLRHPAAQSIVGRHPTHSTPPSAALC